MMRRPGLLQSVVVLAMGRKGVVVPSCKQWKLGGKQGYAVVLDGDAPPQKVVAYRHELEPAT